MPFNLGFPELILILVIALIVFGPRKLPEIGSAVGKAMREFRRATSEITEEFTKPLDEPGSPVMEASSPMIEAPPTTVETPSTTVEYVPPVQTPEDPSQTKPKRETKRRMTPKRSKPLADNHNEKEGADLGG